MCAANACALPWGGSIASGTSVTAYAAYSVGCGSTCSSQTRTCTNGSLSGSYGASSCSVSACPLATASVSVSPNPVAYGGSPSFTLSSTNAYYCHVIMDGVWDWQASGYFTSGTYSPGALTSPGTHSAWAYCYNRDWVGSGWSTTNFTVSSAPTATLSASPTSIAYGGASTLSWSTTNTSSCWADWSGWVATSGSLSTGALTASRSYNLTCYNSTGVSTGTKSVTISVPAIPAPASISGTCNLNGIISLTWTPTAGAIKYLLRIDDQSNPWYTNPPDLINDNVLVANYSYTGASGHSYGAWVHACDALSCGASISSSVISCPLPTITSFTASPNPVDYNTASTLSWNVANVSSCWASGAWTGWKSNIGGTESTGPMPISKAYYLECWNTAVPPVSTGQKSVTVSLNCSPSTDCVEPTCGSDFCKKKPYECVSSCGGDCSVVVCSEKKNCGPCNSGTWKEVAP